jgi:fructose-bisphosphate aldolase class II
MLVNMRDLLADAQNGNYAVGSFSVANMEMVLGVLKAAEELKAPVILQIAEVRLKQSPLEIIGPLMVAAAEAAQTPVAVHFDHGKTIEKISQALDLGFTSVMFDGSHLPLEENIAETKKVIALAEQYDASVEAEIGCVGGRQRGYCN